MTTQPTTPDFDINTTREVCVFKDSGLSPRSFRLPCDEKRLIIHGDDLGLAHSINDATFAAMGQKVLSSASVMVPCPCFQEVAAYAREHADADIGVHLTLTSEWENCRWGPVAARSAVPSLVDPEGYFWADASLASRHAAPAEVEIEVRAQLDRAFQAGIRATHIDSHMFVLFKTHALFAVLVRAAHDYGIPFPVPPSMTCNTHTSVLLRDQVVGLTALLQANPNMHPQNWKRDYLYGLATLRPGLSELIVHLGYSNSELLEITEGRSAWGAEWRQRDFDVLMDPGFREVLAKNEISLVGWKNLKKCRTSTW